MTIASVVDYFVAPKQQVRYFKNTSPNSALYYSSWTAGGNNVPSAGVAPTAANSQPTGIVPTVNTTGAAVITPFSGNGYITQATAQCTIPGRYWVIDRLFHIGATANQTVVLSNQPSYASRIPNDDFTGLQIWYESTGGGGTPTMTVTYTDQSGNTGHSTGAFAVNSGSIGVASQLPLQVGDSGLQKIESTSCTGGTSGYVITVVRPLFHFYIGNANQEHIFPFPTTGLPQIYQDSCIHYYAHGTTLSGIGIDLTMEIASL